MIAHVYLCTNGMTMVFDDRGQQVPDFQGRQRDVIGRLLEETKGHDPLWWWMAFQEWTEPTNRKQVECLWKMWTTAAPAGE